jgi:predicted nucleotidyltransferase
MKTKQTHSANALFPKVRQRVLQLLYGKPDQLFYTNEIIRLTDSGTGAVQRELAKLSDMQLIKSVVFGNQKRYQADQSSPLFADLRNIILKTVGLSDVLREALTPIAAQIQFAFIYGSIASNQDNAKSDIDLMIISDTLTYAEIFSLLEEPQNKLGRQINPTFYSKAEWTKKQKSKNHFVLQIIQKPKIFIFGTEDEFKKY